MDNDFKGTVTAPLLAEKIVQLLEYAFDKDEDIRLTLQLVVDQMEELKEYELPDSSVPQLKAKTKVIPVTYKADIFKFNMYNPNVEVENEGTWKSTLQRCQRKLNEALDDCGTEQHQMYLIHRVLTRGKRAGIGLGLGLMNSRIANNEAIMKQTVLRIDEFLHSGHVLGRCSNDARTFQNMAFVLMSHTAPEEDAPDEEMDAHDKLLSRQASLFALPDCAKIRLAEMSTVCRDILAGRTTDIVQVFKRKSTSLVNDENKAIVKTWIQCGTDSVIPSPFQRDTRAVRDENGKETHREPVYLYKKGKGHLFAAFSKPVDQGGCYIARDEDGEVVIHRTTFEKLLPANLRRMTETHKQICGCKEHKNMQYKHEALLRNRDRRVERFDHLINFVYKKGPGHEAAKTAKAAFVNAAYTEDGKHVWPTPNEAYLSMTCKPVGDEDWMVPYKCTLGHCEACPKLVTAPGETVMTTSNPRNRITYIEICSEYTCTNTKHGFISGYTSNCLQCEVDGIPKSQRPKVTRSEVEVYKSCSIGEFMETVYPKQLRAYSQHRFLCHVKGKNGCLGQREETALDPGCVLCQRDYTTRLPMQFNNATVGVGMNGVPTVGMESMTLRMYGIPRKRSEDEEEPEARKLLLWHGYLSDEKQQDARTSFFNSIKMVMAMIERKLLQEDNEEWLFVVSDGCTKQYKCGNMLQTYIWLSDMFRIPIDVMITAPYHGKSLVDALAGVDKSKLRQDLTDPTGFDSATRDADGNIVEQAERCRKSLAHKDRRYGSVVDTKHKKQPDKTRVDERFYSVSNYDKDTPIPVKDCGFKVDPSQFGNDTKSGLAEMYHFQFHPDMPVDTCACRRIGCFCSDCKEQSKKPWDYGKTAKEQERFKTAENCWLNPMMGDYNDWLFINVGLVLSKTDQAKNDKAKKHVRVRDKGTGTVFSRNDRTNGSAGTYRGTCRATHPSGHFY